MLMETLRERRAYVLKRVIPLNSARTRVGREAVARVKEYDELLREVGAALIARGL